MGKMTVSIFDANTVRRNELVGSFEFDLQYVYAAADHEIYRRWVALTDITDKHEGIQGYLKLSVTVLGPNDIARVHMKEEDDMVDEDDEQGRAGSLAQRAKNVRQNVKAKVKADLDGVFLLVLCVLFFSSVLLVLLSGCFLLFVFSILFFSMCVLVILIDFFMIALFPSCVVFPSLFL